jgi:hypothetical protein
MKRINKADGMTRVLEDRDMASLERMFVDAKGRGFTPKTPRAAVLLRALKAGFVKRADGDFFTERRKGSLIVFTETGKAAILSRMARRYGTDVEDTHHLVKAGRVELASAAAVQPRKPGGEPFVQQEAPF